VEVFELCWRDVAEFFELAAVVESVDPFEGGEFQAAVAPLGAQIAEQFGLVETKHHFGHAKSWIKPQRDPSEFTAPHSARHFV
jgi:hypothetical protein